MGLLSLITRKIAPDRQKNHRLRAPPYERNVSSRSPVRFVQTISGDGSSISAETPSRPAQELRRPWASSAPRLVARDADPSSAGHDSRPRLQSRAGPQPGYSSPEPRRYEPSSSTLSMRTTTSTQLSGKNYTHIDILEARSRIGPTDFHGRIQASGVRDYGEDVADRNIAANGFELDSRPVQESYAGKNSSYMGENRPFSRESTCYDNGSESLHEIRSTPSFDADFWAKALSNYTPNSAVYSKRHSAIVAPCTPKTLKFLKRRSLNVPPSGSSLYMDPLDDILGNSMHSRQTRIDRDHDLFFLREFQPHNLVPQETRFGSDCETDSVAASRPLSRGSHVSATSHTLRHRGRSISSRKDTAIESQNYHSDTANTFHADDHYAMSPQSSSSRLSVAMARSTYSTSSKRTSTRHHSLSAKQTEPRSFALSETILDLPDIPDLPDPPTDLEEEELDRSLDWADAPATTYKDAAPSPCIKTARSLGESFNTAHESLWAHTVDTPHNVAENDEQPLDNLARHWSISSTTPTTSSTSATHARPQSYHTADTSLDIGSTLNPSLISIISGAGCQRSQGSEEHPQPSMQTSMDTGIFAPFNIDDYVSSDSESSKKDENSEEGLLFNAGYGMSGMQLPGLDDACSAPSPVILLQDSRLGTPIEVQDIDQACNPLVYGEDTAGDTRLNDTILAVLEGSPLHRSRSSSRRRSTSLHEARPSRSEPLGRSETKRLSALVGTDEPFFSTFGNSQENGSPHRSYSQRRQRYHSHLTQNTTVSDEVIEEEMAADKFDASVAFRLRKEEKARKRASVRSASPAIRPHDLFSSRSFDA